MFWLQVIINDASFVNVFKESKKAFSNCAYVCQGELVTLLIEVIFKGYAIFTHYNILFKFTNFEHLSILQRGSFKLSDLTGFLD